MKRNFLLALGASILLPIAAIAQSPKYVFYFIGDGMGMGPVMSAATYNRTVVGSDELPLMMTFPVAGQVMTYSASSPVTDSAAAGTALATGHKTKNSMVGMGPDSIPVSSLADILKGQGYGVGLVTNVSPDDATPAAFYAHVINRYMRPEIDTQFATGTVDFLAGAALTGLRDRDGNDTGVEELLKKNNVTVAYGLEAYNAIPDKSGRMVLLGVNPFSDGNMGYSLDSIPGMLTLGEMTGACLDYMTANHPDRFFMMVEGGNIDHALHANDGASAISEVFNFNNSIALAYDFLQKHPDETLIVVTADHDTGGMSVGNRLNGYKAHFDVLSHQKVSKEMFSDMCKDIITSDKPYSWDEMRQLLTDRLGFWNGVNLSDEETASLEKLFTEVFVEGKGADEKTLYNNFNSFASRVYGIISSKAAIGWTSGAHTGNPVPVYAAGVGAERFGRVLNNTEITPTILSIIAGK